MEKSRGMEKREEKIIRGVVIAMSRWLETNYIQSQQTIPLLTEGRLKVSNVKSL